MGSDVRVQPSGSPSDASTDGGGTAGDHAEPADVHLRPTTTRWDRRGRLPGVLLGLLLVLVAGSIRVAGLSHPQRTYFDEIYYAEDAADYLVAGVECGRAVHPMVGKWVIAAGMVLMGDAPQVPAGGVAQWCDREGVGVADTASWRISNAVAGTLTVLVVYLAGVRLFRRRGIAALAALLLAVDGIALTSSRISMLDAVLGLFVVVAFWLLLVDRDRQWSIAPTAASARISPLAARSRVAAGVALGLAVGTKWSALLAIGAGGLVVLGSELAWRHRGGVLRVGWWRPFASAALTLLGVPLVVYVLSYASWFTSYEHTQPGTRQCADPAACSASVLDIVGEWVGEQVANYEFHRDLEAEHRYRALATTWPLQLRPVAYYYESCTQDRDVEEDGPCAVPVGDVEEILGIGNVGVWWVALVVGYPLVVVGLWRRDWRAWVIAAFLLGQYLPWLVAPRPLFLFYTVPLVPFVALSSAYGAWRLSRHRRLWWVPAAVGAVAVAALWFWWPVLVGDTISMGAWRLRILFDSWI